MKKIILSTILLVTLISCNQKKNSDIGQIEKTFELGHSEKAQNDLDQLIKSDSTNALNFFTKGNLLAEENKHKEAIEFFSKCIKLQPDYTTAYNNRGYSYLAIGQIEEAIKDFKKAIELAPKFHEAYNNLGLAYKQIGEFTLALTNFKLATTYKPDYSDALYNLGNTSLQIGKYKEIGRAHV